MAYDPEAGRTWISYLEVDLTVREIETEWGPTRVTDSADSVMVKSRTGQKYGRAVNVSAPATGAKLAPVISARGGVCCVAWCACDPDTKQWNVYINCSLDQEKWTGPLLAPGGGMALHPDVAVDPDTGRVWLAYEDWSHGAVALTGYHDGKWSEAVRLSRGGRNFRPRIIATDRRGRHAGALAVAWDSYRNDTYDIFFCMASPNGEPLDEQRVTRSGRWDSRVDMLEDRAGNIWLTWLRASSEVGDMSAMRDVHAVFFDGEGWRCPEQPGFKYSRADLDKAELIAGFGRVPDRRRRRYLKEHRQENGGGRVTWYTVNWRPCLQVDDRNRVYVFYIAGDPAFPPILRRLKYRVYSGAQWSRPKKVGLGRGNALSSIRDYSVAVIGGNIEGVWERAEISAPDNVLSMRNTVRKPLANIDGPVVRVRGGAYRDVESPGWEKRGRRFRKREISIGGAPHRLLFGDTHAHSAVSIGVDPPDFSYHFARDFAKLDFFALSENDCLFCGTPGTEAYIAFLPKIFARDDFTCFHAHEFVSSAMGHRVMVFEGDDNRVFPIGIFNSQHAERANTTGHLLNFLREFDVRDDARVMVCPHNMINLGNDFMDYDAELEPVYDVASLHFSAEKTFREYRARGHSAGASNVLEFMISLSLLPLGGRVKRRPPRKWYYSWKQCLDRGLQQGVYGSSDSHTSNAPGWILAGVWSTGNTRKEILDAIFAKRTLAMDGGLRMTDVMNTDPVSPARNMKQVPPRMDIRFYLNEHFMGDACHIDAPPMLRLSVENLMNDPVSEIVLVKDGKDVYRKRIHGPGAGECEWTDAQWKPGSHYYYARIGTAGGAVGYSSPVFTT